MYFFISNCQQTENLFTFKQHRNKQVYICEVFICFKAMARLQSNFLLSLLFKVVYLL